MRAAASVSGVKSSQGWPAFFDFEERGLVDIKGKGVMRTYFLISRRAPSQN